MKLNIALATFLKVDRSPRTTVTYRNVLTRLIRWLGEDRPVARVHFEDLLDYFDELRQRGLKAVTIGGYISAAKSFFAWCARQRYCPSSPAAELKLPRAAPDPTRNRAIPPDELKRMIEYARVTSKRNYAIMMMLVDTGCRVGGLESLTLDHLDLDNNRAWLLEKGNAWHEALFGDETAAALRAWLAKRPQTDHAFVWIAQGSKHEPLDRRGIAFVVRRLAEKTEASRIWGPHSIRHSVGHAYERLGISPTVTQAKLGHSNVETTLRFYYRNDRAYVEQVSRRYPLAALIDETPEAPKVVEFPGKQKHG